MPDLKVLLISTYELGRQPCGLASPAAWVRADGFHTSSLDLSRQSLDEEAVRTASLIAFYLPMHTATRIAVSALERVRKLNSSAHLCGFGLYAPFNAGLLRRLGVGTILLRELYQEVILEHNKAPRNYRELATANHRAEGYNPLCGDHFTVYLDLEGDSIRDISFQGSGCAISKASASLMTQSVKGKTRAEAARLFDQFHKLVTGQSPANGNRAELGKLAVFSGVSQFPVRVKCATLAWHTLHASLEEKQGTVSTE